MYAITGASGQLGRLVLDALLAKVEPGTIVALARDPAKLSDYAARGVVVRPFDYSVATTLAPALQGVDRLLLISSNEIGQRVAQHQAVIDAAKATDVGLIAYTSILQADHSPIGLAVEHRATEAAVRESGLRYALLRNGWYNENYTMNAATEIAHGAVIGSTGEGRISAASRADYAAAAAAVLIDETVADRTYELAGDTSFTLADYAATLAAIADKPVAYVHMPEDPYRSALAGVGLPAPVAAMLAQSSASAANGALFDDGHALSTLIARPTTPIRESLAAALA